MEDRVIAELQGAGYDRFHGARAEFQLRNAPFALQVEDESAIPPQFFREKVVTSVDKVAVKAAIQAGEDVPGCSLTTVLERWPDINPARLVIVEHYDDREDIQRLAAKYGRYHAEQSFIGRENGESFDLVTFGQGFEAVLERARRNPGRAVEPVWKRIPKSEVERLIGEVLP